MFKVVKVNELPCSGLLRIRLGSHRGPTTSIYTKTRSKKVSGMVMSVVGSPVRCWELGWKNQLALGSCKIHHPSDGGEWDQR